MEKSDNTKNLALLANNEINVSVLEVAAEGVRVKLWPNADAVRAHLEEATARLPGGLKGYSVRHYVCGRYLYCAIALGDITKDAPCPASYQVNTDSYLNEQRAAWLPLLQSGALAKGCLPCRRCVSARTACRSTRWQAVTARQSTTTHCPTG